jgi:molybdopterin-containing oxidoreductase family membrane subunit
MVMTLAIPLRKAYGLEGLITLRHLDYMARILLATGLIVGYAYTIEAFFAWYSGDIYEAYVMRNRFAGPYAPFYWMLIVCNVLAIQPLWFQRVRQSVVGLFVISMFVNVGMWLERFVIIVTSLHRDYLPSSWGMYAGTRFDYGMFVGSIGLFLTLFFLFIRFMPMISIFEVRTMLPEAEVEEGHS